MRKTEFTGDGAPKPKADVTDEDVLVDGNTARLPVDPERKKLPVTATQWRVLIQPAPVVTMSEGGIDVSATVDKQKAFCSVGQILQMGANAFKAKTPGGLSLADEPMNPECGDWVLYARYAGNTINLKTGQSLVLLSDTDIIAVTFAPQMIERGI